MVRAIMVLAAILFGAFPAAARAKVVVTLWASGLAPATLAAMVTAEHEAHPNIDVRATYFPSNRYTAALARAASSGLLPDIVALSPGAEMARLRGSLIELDPIADSELGKEWDHHFPDKLLSEARLGNPRGDNSFYMLPMTSGVDGLWTDREAEAKAGVQGVPRTMKALAHMGTGLRKAGMEPLVFGGASKAAVTRLFLQILAEIDPQTERAAAQGKTVWTSRSVISAARLWSQLFAGRIVPQNALNLSDDQARKAFAQGHAGILAAGSGLLPHAGQSSHAEWQFFTFPAVPPSVAPAPPVGGIGVAWGITRAATSEEEVKGASAAVLHDLIAGPAAQVAIDRFAGFPAWKDLALHVQPPRPVGLLWDQMRESVSNALPDAVSDPRVEDALSAQLRLLATSKTAPKPAMQAVQAAAQDAERLAG